MFKKFFTKKQRDNKKIVVTNRPTPTNVVIGVEDLRVGMFICALDRPWLETPFAIQGFHILSKDDIDEVSKHCQSVEIDTNQSDPWLFIGDKSKPPSAKSVHDFSNSANNADKQYKRVHSLTKNMLDDIRLGTVAQTKQVKTIVSECVTEVLNNPQAIMWINQMAAEGKGLERHAIGSCILAVGFGDSLNLTGSRLLDLGMAALLHDVGMAGLPTTLKNKLYKHEELTTEERQTLQSHTVIGRDTLASNSSFWCAVDVAYSHHERWDGKGYPRGLKANKIPFFANIVSLVDAYDSMTSPNSYKPAVSSVEALKSIYSQKAKQFNPNLVDRFISYIGLYPPGSIIGLKNGEIAVVIEHQGLSKQLPTVIIVKNKNLRDVRPILLSLSDAFKKGKVDRNVIKSCYPAGSFGIDANTVLASYLTLKESASGM